MVSVPKADEKRGVVLYYKYKIGKINVKECRSPVFIFFICSMGIPIYVPYVSDTVYGTHTVATAAFWRTFRHDGKISPGW
jgi:hypothetical protein